MRDVGRTLRSVSIFADPPDLTELCLLAERNGASPPGVASCSPVSG
jgi:hypothetical protein